MTIDGACAKARRALPQEELSSISSHGTAPVWAGCCISADIRDSAAASDSADTLETSAARRSDRATGHTHGTPDATGSLAHGRCSPTAGYPGPTPRQRFSHAAAAARSGRGTAARSAAARSQHERVVRSAHGLLVPPPLPAVQQSPLRTTLSVDQPIAASPRALPTARSPPATPALARAGSRPGSSTRPGLRQSSSAHPRVQTAPARAPGRAPGSTSSASSNLPESLASSLVQGREPLLGRSLPPHASARSTAVLGPDLAWPLPAPATFCGGAVTGAHVQRALLLRRAGGVRAEHAHVQAARAGRLATRAAYGTGAVMAIRDEPSLWSRAAAAAGYVKVPLHELPYMEFTPPAAAVYRGYGSNIKQPLV